MKKIFLFLFIIFFTTKVYSANPATGDATLSGVIVECDIKTGLSKNIESYIFGGQLKNSF